MKSPTATLLISCPDQRGLVATFGNFIADNGGNIVDTDQHSDTTTGLFLTRLEWELDGFTYAREEISAAFEKIAGPLGAQWELKFSDTLPKVAIWVSHQEHCLIDLLWRLQSRELQAKVSFILSNHETLRPVANQHGIPFYYVPITKESRKEKEQQQLSLLREHAVDLVVLAKYMQILSQDFLAQFPQVINIHHSFLPAFIGAKPYHAAYQRGVKIIGATAHYATDTLDGGPIIEQDVVRVSHRDEVADLLRKGRDLERIVLARALRHHLRNRVLVYHNRTVVFE